MKDILTLVVIMILFYLYFNSSVLNRSVHPDYPILGGGNYQYSYDAYGEPTGDVVYNGYSAEVLHTKYKNDTVTVFMSYAVWGEEDFEIKISKYDKILKKYSSKKTTGVLSFSLSIVEKEELLFEISIGKNSYSEYFYGEPYEEEFYYEEEEEPEYIIPPEPHT